MLRFITSALAGPLLDSLLGPVTKIFQAYFDKKITEAELRTQLQTALIASFADVEKSHAETVAKTYESFQTTLRTSPIMQWAWCWVVYTQLAVLIWHQVGIPAFILITGLKTYPSSGSTVEWAYLLLGFCLGAGSLVLRSGPGALDISRFKSLIGK